MVEPSSRLGSDLTGAAPGEASAGTAEARGHLAVLTTDHEWRVVDVSSYAERLLGAGRRELTGSGLIGMAHPGDAGRAAEALARLDDDHDTVATVVRLRTGAGWRPLRLSAAKLCAHLPPRLACLLLAEARPLVQELAPHTTEPAAEPGALPDPMAVALERARRHHRLTERQLEVVMRLMRAETPGEIAGAMFLSVGTVRNQLTQIYRQFGVHSQSGLLAAIYADPGRED